jgi:hypothetical protein
MDDPVFKFTFPYPDREQNWTILRESLSTAFPVVPDDQAPPECQFEVGCDVPETIENYQDAEMPYILEIEDVIRTLCATGEATSASKAVAYFLGCRPCGLRLFFAKFCTSNINDEILSFSTIVPFPSLPVLRVAQWFLLHWWQRWGALEMAEHRYLRSLGVSPAVY